jgi:hypothetical protein
VRTQAIAWGHQSRIYLKPGTGQCRDPESEPRHSRTAKGTAALQLHRHQLAESCAAPPVALPRREQASPSRGTHSDLVAIPEVCFVRGICGWQAGSSSGLLARPREVPDLSPFRRAAGARSQVSQEAGGVCGRSRRESVVPLRAVGSAGRGPHRPPCVAADPLSTWFCMVPGDWSEPAQCSRKGRQPAASAAPGGRSFPTPSTNVASDSAPAAITLQACRPGRGAAAYGRSLRRRPLPPQATDPQATSRPPLPGMGLSARALSVPTPGVWKSPCGHAKVLASGSRCHQPAPGYDPLSQRRFARIPRWGFFVFLLYQMRSVDGHPRERRAGGRSSLGRGPTHVDPSLPAVSGSLGMPAFLASNRRDIAHFLGEGVRCGRRSSRGGWSTAHWAGWMPSAWMPTNMRKAINTGPWFIRSIWGIPAGCG